MNRHDSSPMIQLFIGSEVQVTGTVENPLFNTRDVAMHIGDDNYRRNVKDYSLDFIAAHPSIDKLGRSRTVLFFTEEGLYKYLMHSHKEKASSFQRQVYVILKHERRRIVDDALLSAKIANMRLSQCQQELADCTAAKEALEEECAELDSINEQLGRVLETVPGVKSPVAAETNGGLTASGIELFLARCQK